MQYSDLIKKAIASFWLTKKKQLEHSGDTTNRGAVVGGKQLDGFAEMLKVIALAQGVPKKCIYTSQTYLPGFFRSSKNWDFLIISPKNKLVAVVEFKSQIGSYGNNFNNRTEEALGDAVDFWTAFRDNQYPYQNIPWVGYLTIVGKDNDSLRPVKNYEPFYPVLEEFKSANYIDRYKILCQKLVKERHYTSTALICTSGPENYENVSEDTSIENFLQSYVGHLIGSLNEFK